MRFASLTQELDSITKDYDYGIVPGSAAIFVKDEVLGIGRLDLTLLEGVMVVIEVSNQGYKIASSSPLSDDPATLAAAEQVQACVDRESFETMENLLMTASPMFRERFHSNLYDKLHQVQQQQLMEEGQQQQHSLINPVVSPPSHSRQQPTSSPILLSSPSSTLSNSYYHHNQHTNLPQATSSTLNNNSNNTTSLDQQDVLDEINQWIH